MKVVHLEYGRHLYGGPQQVRHLVAGLSREAVDNVVICRPGAALAQTLPGAKVIEVPLYGDCDLGAVRRLRAVLRAERPDVLHVHSRGGADLFGGIAGRAEGVATVLTRRVDSPEPRYWAYFKYRNYDAVAAISRAVETQLTDKTGLRRARVHRIASAVDSGDFSDRVSARKTLERDYGVSTDDWVIGVVAQLIKRKGHDVLFAALPAILRRHPRAQVLCFGRGPAAGALRRKLAASPLLRARVRLLGYEPNLPKLMPGFDLLVHPARAEGLGVAVLEAMSCGVPVIASGVGGIPDCIEHTKTGILLRPDDAAALAAAVIALLDAPEQRRAIAAAARTSVLAHHSVGAMAARYLELYGALQHDRRLPH